MQRLNTLRFALAGGIYGVGCVALATICALVGVPGFKPFTDLLVQFYGFYGYSVSTIGIALGAFGMMPRNTSFAIGIGSTAALPTGLHSVFTFLEARLLFPLRLSAVLAPFERKGLKTISPAPVSRPVQRTGIIRSHAILGGLHHHYVRV